jgi:hypothetical protein
MTVKQSQPQSSLPRDTRPQRPETALDRFLSRLGDVFVSAFAVTVIALMGLLLAAVAALLLFNGATAVVGYFAANGLSGAARDVFAAWGAAWQGLINVTVGAPGQTFAGLVIENAVYGAIAGTVLGLWRFQSRWRGAGRSNHQGHKWAVEAIVSPSFVSALSYGVLCLGLYLAVAILSSLIFSWLGLGFQGLGGEPQLVLTGTLAAIGGGGGGMGDPAGFGLMWFLVLLLLVLIPVAAAVFCSYGLSLCAWILMAAWRSNAGTAVQDAAISGASYAMGLAAMAALIQFSQTRLWVSRAGSGLSKAYAFPWATLPAEKTFSRSERLALYRHDLGFDNGDWGRDAVWSGVVAGAAQSVLFTVLALSLAILFGVTMS